jgi:hypothetical protein
MIQPARSSCSLGRMSTVRVLELSRDHAFGVIPGVMLYVWRGTTTVAAAHGIGEGLRLVRDDGSGLPTVLFGVVEASTPPPDSEPRKVLAESMKSAGGYLKASALGFEGEGFQASMVRGVAVGLALLARTPFPHQAFASVPLAAEFVAKTVPQHSAAKLLDALQQLRAVPKP